MIWAVLNTFLRSNLHNRKVVFIIADNIQGDRRLCMFTLFLLRAPGTGRDWIGHSKYDKSKKCPRAPTERSAQPTVHRWKRLDGDAVQSKDT